MPSKIKKSIHIGRTVDGKEIRKYFYGRTKKEVNAKIDAYKLQVATGKNVDDIGMPFADWADRWLATYKEGNVSAATYEMYALAVRHLNDHFGDVSITAIRPIDFKKFFNKNSDYSESMINKLFITANLIFKTALANGIAFVNPLDGMAAPKGKKPRPRNVWTIDQASIAFDFALHHRFGLGPALILKTGMRRGELMGIMPLFDIDVASARLAVRRTVTDVNGIVKVKDGGKSRSATRTIPLDPQAVDWIRSDDRFRRDGFLFQTSTGTNLAPHNWSARQFRPFMDDLISEHPTLPRLTPHELRHTYGTILFQAGTDIFTLQRIMGHANVGTTTKIYVHDNIDDVQGNVRFPGGSGTQKVPRNTLRY